MGLKMGVQLGQLRGVEERFAAGKGHRQQPNEVPVLVRLEVASHRVGIKQQGIGNVCHRATLAQENHGIDPSLPYRLAGSPEPRSACRCGPTA